MHRFDLVRITAATVPGVTGSPPPPDEPNAVFLTDGGQPVEVAADRLVAFLTAARSSLDVAIYDAHFDVDHHHIKRPDSTRAGVRPLTRDE